MTDIALVLLIQNAELIRQDIYVYTKIGIIQYSAIEGNSIAREIFKFAGFDAAYVMAMTGQAIGMILADRIDGSGILSYLTGVIIGLAEIQAISTWDSFRITPISVKANIFIYRF